jgi:hypothetical protein
VIFGRAAKVKRPHAIERKIREQSDQIIENERHKPGEDAHHRRQNGDIAETKSGWSSGSTVMPARPWRLHDE